MYGLFLVVECTLLIVSAAIQLTRGETIFCRCNTWDCEDQSLNVCATEIGCYVQVTASEDPSEPPDILYGCLSQTSILCQNPRPQYFQGAWPIVQCCDTSLCNRDILPTEPPDWHRGKDPSTVGPQNGPSSTTPQASNITARPDRHIGAKSSLPTAPFRINPLYIAVPIVGAVILVFLVIFAVYLLRRQPRNPSEYKYHSAPQLSAKPPPEKLHCTTEKHNGLLLPAAPRNNPHNALVPPRNHNVFMVNEKAAAGVGLPVMAVEPFNSSRTAGNRQQTVRTGGNIYTPPGQGYPRDRQLPSREFPSHENSEGDGERSSSGSESKLLLRV